MIFLITQQRSVEWSYLVSQFYGSGDRRLGDVESHDWKVGDACIALFPTKNGGDDRYYRAKVEAMDQNKV